VLGAQVDRVREVRLALLDARVTASAASRYRD
jgi:hypothetical protein